MKILFVTARPPWPGRRGDQARVGGFVKILGRRHDVRIVALEPPGFSSGEPPPGIHLDTVDVGRQHMLIGVARGSVGFVAGRRPLQAALFDHRRLHRAVAKVVERWRPDVAVVVLSRLADVLPVLDGCPVVLDLIDALGLNMWRRGDRGGLLAPLWAAEARRLDRWDASAVSRVARATVVAERDRQAILDGSPESLRRAVEERLTVVPFGLDLDLDLDPSPRRAPPTPTPTLITSGNLGYFPTVEGIRWLAAEIWPRIRARRPDARWRLAGARPAPAIRSLASREGIELIPNPDDLRVLVRGADIAMAPLRAGSGTPIKILEAMADGVPVVTTTGGVAGLDDLPEGAVAVADDPESFANAVLQLLDEPERAGHATASARAWLARHRLESVTESFEAVLSEAVSDARRPAPR